MAIRSASITIGVLSLVGGLGGAASALFTDGPNVGSNTFSTAILEPPTAPSATAVCNGTSNDIDLSWTATVSTFADGYDIQRSTTDGGPYTVVHHATGRTTTTYTDPALTASTTYYYVIRSTANNWTSVDTTQVSATTAASC